MRTTMPYASGINILNCFSRGYEKKKGYCLMIICSICKKETSVPINSEFICFDCYDKRRKNKGVENRTRPEKLNTAREIKEDNTGR